MSDPKAAAAQAFGFKPGARNTVVISKDGTIEHLYMSVQAGSHAKDIFSGLGK